MRFVDQLRDYFSDVEAVVASKNPSFRLSSLTVWADLIETPALPSCLQPGDDSSAEVLAAQEQASASRFHEVKIKLSADCQAMQVWNAEKAKISSKHHVAKVLHEKAQIETGKKLLDRRNKILHFSQKIKRSRIVLCSIIYGLIFSPFSGLWMISCKAIAGWD